MCSRLQDVVEEKEGLKDRMEANAEEDAIVATLMETREFTMEQLAAESARERETHLMCEDTMVWTTQSMSTSSTTTRRG